MERGGEQDYIASKINIFNINQTTLQIKQMWQAKKSTSLQEL